MSTPNVVLVLGLPGGMEMLVILLVVLIFFGHRIPGLARSLGSGITEFKSGLKDGEKQLQDGVDEASRDESPSQSA